MKNLIKYWWLFVVFCPLFAFRNDSEESVPIYFSEYGVTVLEINKLGDTLHYNKSSKENFKFVFYDERGKCYCERYVNNVLQEKGYYENSLDTLKRYTSGRFANGKTSPMKVQKYFQPLKNGEWIIRKGGREVKEIYSMGILNKH